MCDPVFIYEKFAESGENNENYGEAMFRGHNKEAVQKQYETLYRECHFNIFKNCYKKGADCTCNQEMESYRVFIRYQLNS